MSDATRTITTRLRLEGESEYSAQVSKIGSAQSELRSQLALVASSFEGQLNSYEALSKKGEILGQMYDEQQKKLNVYIKALTAAIDAQDAYEQAVSETRAKLDAENQSYEKIRGTVADTSEAQKRHAEQVKALNAELAVNSENLQKADNTVSQYTAKVNYAQKDLNDFGRKVDENNGYLDETGRVAGGAATSIDGYGKAVKQAADDSQELGDKGGEAINALAAALAAAGIKKGIDEIADALRACVGASIEFESAMAGVFKTVDGTDAQLAAITDGIKKLSTEIPLTAKELAGIAESAGQLGIATEDVLKFSEVMAKLGTATDLTSDQAATMLAQFANVTGLDPSKYENMASAIVDLGNNSATTESKIVNMAQGMAGAASMAGFSEADILALAASVSSLGIEAQAGSSSMSKLITELQKAVETGTGLNEFAQVAGTSAEAFAKTWEERPVEALNAFVQGLNDTKRNGKSALVILDEMGLSEQRLSRAITQLAKSGDLLSDSVVRSNKAWEENTALSIEAATRFETTESKLQLLDNSVNLLKTSIGDQLKPALDGLISAGTDVIDWARGFIEQNEWLVPTITALAAALTTAGVAIGGLTVAVNVAIPAIKALGVALGGLPVVGIIAGVTAVVGAVVSLALTSTRAAPSIKSVATSLDEVKTAAAESKKAYEETTAAMNKNAADTSKLVDRVYELAGKTNKTAAETAVLRSLIDELNESVPDLNLRYDELSGTLSKTAKQAQNFVKAMFAQAQQNSDVEYLVKLENERLQIEEQKVVAAEEYFERRKALLDYESQFEAEQLEAMRSNPAANVEYTNLIAVTEYWKTTLDDATASLLNNQEQIDAVSGSINDNSASLDDNIETHKTFLGILEAVTAKQEEHAKASRALASDIDTLTSALDEYSKNGELSISTINDLIESGYALALQVDEETGAVTLNHDAYVDLAQAKIDERITSLQIDRNALVGALNSESSAANALADAMRGAAVANIDFAASEYEKQAAMTKGATAGYDAQIAGLQKLRESIGSYTPGSGSGGGGGGGGGSKQKTVADTELEAFKDAVKELDELRKYDEISAEEYYSRLKALADEYLQDPLNASSLKETMYKIREYTEESMTAALEAVNAGYLSIADAAEVFGLSLEEITERHSLAKAYDKQMYDAAEAVVKGTMSMKEAMDAFGLSGETAFAALRKEVENFTDKTKDAYETQLAAATRFYEAGILSAQEYYARLTALRDQYLDETTIAWREASEKIDTSLQGPATTSASGSGVGSGTSHTAESYAARYRDDSVAPDPGSDWNGFVAHWKRNWKRLADEKLSDLNSNIAAMVAAEQAHQDAVIAGINEEIAARRQLWSVRNATENSDDRLKKAQEKVADAEKALERARAEVAYARDENARIEAEKLVIQKEEALKSAQEALTKAARDHEDQLWVQQKNDEIAAANEAKEQAVIKAEQDRLKAEQEVGAWVNGMWDWITQETQRREYEAKRETYERIQAQGGALGLVAGKALDRMASNVTNEYKTIELNVTYTTQAATSGQLDTLVKKAENSW